MTLPTLSKTSKQKTKWQSENIRHVADGGGGREDQPAIHPFISRLWASVFGQRLRGQHLHGQHLRGQSLRTASPQTASPRPTSPRPTSPRPASPRLGPASWASVFASWVSVLGQRLWTASPRTASPRPASSRLGPASSDSVFTPSFHVFTSWSGIFASTAFAASVSESQYTKKKLLEHLTQ